LRGDPADFSGANDSRGFAVKIKTNKTVKRKV